MLRVYPKQFLGRGAFARVYALNKKQVIKIFWPLHNRTDTTLLLQDEIKGSKRLKSCLPVIRIAAVEVFSLGKWCKTRGLVKKKLTPLTSFDLDEVDRLIGLQPKRRWQGIQHFEDHKLENVGVDENDVLWIMDTQRLSGGAGGFAEPYT
jgi:hypothetical protein